MSPGLYKQLRKSRQSRILIFNPSIASGFEVSKVAHINDLLTLTSTTNLLATMEEKCLFEHQCFYRISKNVSITDMYHENHLNNFRDSSSPYGYLKQNFYAIIMSLMQIPIIISNQPGIYCCPSRRITKITADRCNT